MTTVRKPPATAPRTFVESLQAGERLEEIKFEDRHLLFALSAGNAQAKAAAAEQLNAKYDRSL